MFEVETDKEEPGLVMQVLQPGYAIEDRVLRAAMVGVSKSHAADQPEGVDEKVWVLKNNYLVALDLSFFAKL